MLLDNTSGKSFLKWIVCFSDPQEQTNDSDYAMLRANGMEKQIFVYKFNIEAIVSKQVFTQSRSTWSLSFYNEKFSVLNLIPTLQQENQHEAYIA